MISEKIYRYSIDTFNGRFVNGWCFNRLSKQKRLTLKVIADGQLITTGTNGEYRHDLKSQELHPTGVCGFDISFSPEFIPEQYQTIELFLTGRGKPLISLPGTSIERLEPDREQRIWFMHIPKTAGSSFNAFLRRCYPQARYTSHLERLKEHDRGSAATTNLCISGHLPWYQMKTLVKQERYIFYSLIRDPHRHLHSHLNYVRQVALSAKAQGNYDYQHNDTIRGLAEKLNAIDFRNNHDINRFVSDLAEYELDFFDNMQTRYFLDYRPEKVSLQDLDNAKKNIDHFQLVGLTEAYDRFVDRFCGHVGLASPADLQRSNISGHYQLYEQGLNQNPEENRLTELVSIDRLLYQHISNKFWAHDQQ